KLVLAASQLLAKSSELLIRCEGTCRLCRCLGCRSCIVGLGRVVSGSCLGLSCFCSSRTVALDLSGVQLEATLGLSVACLPSLTLLVEAFLPLIGLRVEAFWEHVVALLIVGVSHAVLGWVELFGLALICLPEGRRAGMPRMAEVGAVAYGDCTGDASVAWRRSEALYEVRVVNDALDA